MLWANQQNSYVLNRLPKEADVRTTSRRNKTLSYNICIGYCFTFVCSQSTLDGDSGGDNADTCAHSASIYSAQSDLVVNVPMADAAITKFIECTVIWHHLFKKMCVQVTPV